MKRILIRTSIPKRSHLKSNFRRFNRISLNRKNLIFLKRKFSSNEVVVPLELIKLLRKETGAGLKDCRDSLMATNNNLEEAKLWLDKQHDNVVKNKRDRVAKEGGILSFVLKNVGVVFELNCETDFAGKEKTFLSVMRKIFGALEKEKWNEISVESTLLLLTSSGKTVQEEIAQLSYLLKEKVILTRLEVFPKSQNKNTRVFNHIHRTAEGDNELPKIGRIVSFIEISFNNENLTEKQEEDLKKFGSDLCIQVTGYSPKYITKPEGQEASKDVILLEQEYVMEPNITVGKAIEKFQKKTGITITINNMLRWTLGN